MSVTGTIDGMSKTGFLEASNWSWSGVLPAKSADCMEPSLYWMKTMIQFAGCVDDVVPLAVGEYKRNAFVPTTAKLSESSFHIDAPYVFSSSYDW